jgi:hypothetical protein
MLINLKCIRIIEISIQRAFVRSILNKGTIYTVIDILPSLKERDSSGFYEAWDSTPSRFLVGFC